MPHTKFLSNRDLWVKLAANVKTATRVDAAIAYVGQNGAALLPFRRGSRLVVDMSLPTVKSGSTDPREIEKLLNRKVQVFSRRNLHAKVVVADGTLIAGSANVSKRSGDLLDEAGILTNHPTAVRRALEFIERLCTEPIGKEYLELCKRLYKPPKMNGNGRDPGTAQKQTQPAKLWLVNLKEFDIPESEANTFARSSSSAEAIIKPKASSTLQSFTWPSEPAMAKQMQPGDWIIQVTTYKNKIITVSPPCQLISIVSYVRNKATKARRWVFHLEARKNGQSMPWSNFDRVLKSLIGNRSPVRPRTMPIRDTELADKVLGLWTASARISRRRDA